MAMRNRALGPRAGRTHRVHVAVVERRERVDRMRGHLHARARARECARASAPIVAGDLLLVGPGVLVQLHARLLRTPAGGDDVAVKLHDSLKA